MLGVLAPFCETSQFKLLWENTVATVFFCTRLENTKNRQAQSEDTGQTGFW